MQDIINQIEFLANDPRFYWSLVICCSLMTIGSLILPKSKAIKVPPLTEETNEPLEADSIEQYSDEDRVAFFEAVNTMIRDINEATDYHHLCVFQPDIDHVVKDFSGKVNPNVLNLFKGLMEDTLQKKEKEFEEAMVNSLGIAY